MAGGRPSASSQEFFADYTTAKSIVDAEIIRRSAIATLLGPVITIENIPVFAV